MDNLTHTNVHKVTRFEVIDNTGRVLVRTDVSVEFSLQDEGKTLKVFVGKPTKPENSYPVSCPECDSETFVAGGDVDYDNVWCVNGNCQWFTEVDR